MKWHSIIDEIDLKLQIEGKIEDIADSLEKFFPQINELGFFNGKAGIVLFFCYYNKYKNCERFTPQIENFLSEFLKDLDKPKYIGLTYSLGYPGILWFIHFLREEFIEIDDIPLNFFEPFFENAQELIIKDKSLDFLNGPIGTLFALNEILMNKTKFLELIQNIKGTGVEDEKLFTPPYSHIRDLDIKVINLGLSHGISSLIVLLCNLHSKYGTNDIKEFIEKTTNFLISKKYTSEKKMTSLYPSWIEYGKSTEENMHSRLSWCYGDLGHGMAIYRASKVLSNEQLKQLAVDVFLFNASRRQIEETNIKDAEFCHGAIGIAQIFNRMYHETEVEIFKETATYWYNETIKYAVYNTKCAGFQFYKNTGIQEDYSFLEGITGIGLALISSVSNIEPKWDKCLLLS